MVCILDKLSTLQAHPDVPVVDNLEDIWLVSKLQEERKAKQKHQERAQQLQQYKQVIQHNEATAVTAWHQYCRVTHTFCVPIHVTHIILIIFHTENTKRAFLKVITCDQWLTA